MALLKKLETAFNSVDTSNDHVIQINELEDCCKELGIELKAEDKEHFFKYSSVSKNGLDFNGFCIFIKSRLKRIFEEIDKNGNGFIDFYEINNALQKMNINLSNRQVHAILKGMDCDNDNQVDFNEFCIFFAELPSPTLQAIASKWGAGCGLDFGTDVVPTTLPSAEMPLLRFMLAGGLAGVVSRTLTAPLEKLKILAQTSQQKVKLMSTTMSVLQKQGIAGLFAGNLVNCLRIFPTSAVVCLVYSRMIKYTPVDNQKNPHQSAWRFTSGVTAGIIATSLTHPIDVVRARLTVQDIVKIEKPLYSGLLLTLKKIHQREGVRGLYKGLFPSLLSIGPFLGAQQCIYDNLKIYASTGIYGNNPLTFFLCGTLAGASAQTLVHPLDVVRRQMQVNSGTVLSLKDLWRGMSVRRLYAGLVVSYFKVIPAAATSLLVRDAILGRLK